MLRAAIAGSSIVVSVLWGQPASASEKLTLARKMLSAFTCATYAGHAKKQEEQRRLFDLGLKSGRDFIAAAQAQEFTDEQFKTEVPFLGVRLYLEGPSADFMIGRIYENASNEAFTDITGRGFAGSPLPPEQQIANVEIQKSIAERKYREANCTFLK